MIINPSDCYNMPHRKRDGRDRWIDVFLLRMLENKIGECSDPYGEGWVDYGPYLKPSWMGKMSRNQWRLVYLNAAASLFGHSLQKTNKENFVVDAIICDAITDFISGIEHPSGIQECHETLKRTANTLALIAYAKNVTVDEFEFFIPDLVEEIMWDSDYEIFSPTKEMWSDVLTESIPINCLEREFDLFVETQPACDEFNRLTKQCEKFLIDKCSIEFEKEEKETKPQKTDLRDDSLYLMKDRACGGYKIGRSKNPKVREQTLQYQKPDIIMVGQWKSLGYLERRAHIKYSSQRVRGEWFNLSDIQVEFFCRAAARGELEKFLK